MYSLVNGVDIELEFWVVEFFVSKFIGWLIAFIILLVVFCVSRIVYVIIIDLG